MPKRFQYAVVTMSTCVVALLLFGAVYGRSQSSEQPYHHLGVFTEVLSRIKSEYVEEPNMKNVTNGAISGLLESVDSFASYLTSAQYETYLIDKAAKKADVGLMIAKRFGYLAIVSSAPNSPAAKEGLGTGDVIEAINNVSTRDMPLAYAEILLRGEPGSTVELTVLRVRRPEPQKLKLVREAISYNGVTGEMLADQIGRVEVGSLNAGRAKEVATKVAELEKQGARKMILDLRNCAMGNPEEGFPLANVFVDKGLLGYLQGQTVARQDFNADAGKSVSKLPMAVLINRGTANGCEVAAGALLDTKRGSVIGERTFGSAAVRKAVRMEDGSAVILSVAKYFSPSGKALQDTGVTPAMAVAEAELPPEADDDDQPDTAPQPPPAKPSEDPVLKRAIEVLKGSQKAFAAPVPVDDGRAHPAAL